MVDESRKQLRKKLTIVGMILYVAAILVPWGATTGVQWRSFFWSFTAYSSQPRINWWNIGISTYGGWFFLKDFWFGGLARVFSDGLYTLRVNASGSPTGLFSGWFIVFLFQMLTVSLWLLQLARFPLANGKAFGLIPLFAGASSFFGFYQCYAQQNMVFQQFNWTFDTKPYVGLWMSLISVILLTVAFLDPFNVRSLERSELKKATSVVFLVLTVGFLIIYQADMQTTVVKTIIVQKNVGTDKLPGNPNEWTPDYNRIVAITSLFGAHVIWNAPSYFYCYVEVPIFSCGNLKMLLISMGYGVHDVAFSHEG